MKILYLLKRVFAFFIDVLIYYLSGLVFYIALGNKSLPFGMDKITCVFFVIIITVIIMGIYYPIRGQSIGQRVFKLKYHYFLKEHNKFKLALIRSCIMLLFIIPVIPLIYLLILILIFIIFSIKPFINQKRLFIDLLTGIEVIEYNKNEKDI